ncbi:MAG: NAD(P)H-dependent oxidoreductase subunit E [Oscillospiraceae bacterium]|nr:NAD(P)H-dependent oxidoreductase subunit E [Oscillospiraceae bacterium]
MGCGCVEGRGILKSPIDLSLLDPTLKKYAEVPGSLILVLQKSQELYGYLPNDLLLYIARRMNIKLTKVFGVVTFYTQFRTTPVGKHLILLCQGTACHVNGSSEVEASIREYTGVNEGEITPNGLFTYSNVACLGCCSLAPAMMIGDKTYGNLTKESAARVLKEIEQKELAE